MHESKQIALYVINRCYGGGHAVSNLMLQGIMYSLQRRSLKEYGEPLFDGIFEARPFGPCLPSVYYEYCTAGSTALVPIKDRIWYMPPADMKEMSVPEWANGIIDAYASRSQDDFREDIRRPKGAYHTAYARYDPGKKFCGLPDWPIITNHELRKKG